MAITINTKSYTQDKVEPAAVTLAGPGNNFTTKQLVRFARTAPKPVKDFAGVARSELKATSTFVTNVATDTRGDSILAVTSSIPVGTSPADQDTLIADFRAWVASTYFADLVKSGKFNIS